LVLFVFVMPLGTNIAGGLMPAIAGDWRASADLVALISGVLGGVAAMLGAVVGGYFSDLIDRRGAYVLFGVVQGVCVLAMAIAPHTPAMFAVFALTYQVIGGMAFGAYAAVALEAIGAGAAATKFNLLASVANAPLLYCALIEGWVAKRYGASAMLASEAVMAVAGALLFAAFAALTRPRRASAAPAA
jgi:MFS family permease